MNRVDLNCDIGEGYGVCEYGPDSELTKLITSANIACGFHAGDYNQMFKTVALCLENGVAIGAHPGYPDLAGFGRRPMKFGYDEIKFMVLYQCGALTAIAAALGGKVTHVKPHGELYNASAMNPETAAAVADAVERLNGPALVVLAGSQLAREAQKRGLTIIREGFADRGYNPDGTLADRRSGGALITDPEASARQALQMIQEKSITCLTGEVISVEIDSICVHGDTPDAVGIVRKLRQTLAENNIVVANPLREI